MLYAKDYLGCNFESLTVLFSFIIHFSILLLTFMCNEHRTLKFRLDFNSRTVLLLLLSTTTKLLLSSSESLFSTSSASSSVES